LLNTKERSSFLTASAFSNPEAVALKMVTLSYERSKEVSSDSKEPQGIGSLSTYI